METRDRDTAENRRHRIDRDTARNKRDGTVKSTVGNGKADTDRDGARNERSKTDRDMTRDKRDGIDRETTRKEQNKTGGNRTKNEQSARNGRGERAGNRGYPGRKEAHNDVCPERREPRGGARSEQRELTQRPARACGRVPLCPVFGKCGGCQMLDIPYAEQLDRKQRSVETLLKGLCPVRPITGMDVPFHYRNKVHAVFGSRKGEIISGIYQEDSHQLVPVDSCMIEDEKADEIVASVRELARSFKFRAYDEDTGQGFLRHVLVKRGFSTGEIMVVLVTSSPVFPSRDHFLKALLKRHPEITTVIQNQNDRSTSMVLGDRERVLFGKGYIEDQLCGYRFRISSRSFYQVNPVQTEKLYAKAMELAGLTGNETVIDAYCGTGTIGIIASGLAGRVTGVELNRDAVRDAIANAKRGQIKNIRFYQNDAAAFMTDMARQGEHADVIFMDPPRSGSTEGFIRAAAALRPSRMVYISCDPETLARDLRVFRSLGCKAEEAWPYDLFPQTSHVECAVLMSRGRD